MTPQKALDELRLAVVLPALNEEQALPATLASLTEQSAPADRLLVVDGGSCDATVTVAQANGADCLVAVGLGRGGQVAAGVESLDTDVVVVAHADMLFPPQALQSVRKWLADNPDCPGGCLGHRFDSPRPAYRLIEWYDRRRARRGISYGDQAQFFCRQRLASVGGFPRQPMMEDVELSMRLLRLGKPVYLDLPVTVSPRRFEQHGLFRSVWRNSRLRRIYRRDGVAACRAILESYYARALSGML